ncbi:hypothetical protein GGR53DRAFT_530793 [Hypoxylon sp. FL1150]|nr:hypothetical protein GGR53DRAFT_530793 [Hypoxylon sp. FL1150]
MPKKHRLYFALYQCEPGYTSQVSGYRYGFIIGHKDEPRKCCGNSYNIIEQLRPGLPPTWRREDKVLLDVRYTYDLLARILIAKVVDFGEISAILRDTPNPNNAVNFSSYIWCREMVARIASNPRAVNVFHRYRWGFLIGPKHENKPSVPGLRCHVKRNTPTEWEYEETPTPDVRTGHDLLARVLIAKIINQERLLAIIRDTTVTGGANYNSQTWCQHVAARIKDYEGYGKAVGPSTTQNWRWVEREALRYVDWKTSEGRYISKALPKPTWDALAEKEIMR